MILEEQRGDDRALVAYDRRSSGSAAKKDAMVINGITGKVSFPQNEDISVSISLADEDGDSIDVICQVVDPNGDAVAGIREVTIRTMAETAGEGDLAAAAGTAVGTVVLAANAAAGENVMWMRTTAAGAFSFSVADVAAEEVLVTIELNNARLVKTAITFAA